jgi:membrane protease YdiL (CAAX protease family)
MAATVIGVRSPMEQPVPPTGRRSQLLELGVFLFLIVPSMALSFIIPPQQEQVAFDLNAVATILRDLALVALVCYFLWRSGESLRALGWTSRHVGRDIALGVVLFVPLFIGARWLEAFLIQLGLTAASSPPSLVPQRGAADLLLALVLVVVVAISEETIFRGYLLLRLRPVVRSTALALGLASIIFMLGHGYEGSAGVVTVGVIGVVFGLVYVWRRSLVAPATMHFLLDAIAIVVVPLLR